MVSCAGLSSLPLPPSARASQAIAKLLVLPKPLFGEDVDDQISIDRTFASRSDHGNGSCVHGAGTPGLQMAVVLRECWSVGWVSNATG